MVRVYLDSSFISRITDYPKTGPRTLCDEDKHAVDQLSDSDDIEFVTSKKALEEFQKSSDPDRRVILKLVYRLMTKISSEHLVNASLYGQALYGQGTYGGSFDPLYDRLKQIFDDDDAQHIFQAVKAKCNYFLTLDASTILNRARAKEGEVRAVSGGMGFVTPSQLQAQIEEAPAGPPP